EDAEDDRIYSYRWQFDGYALKTLSNSGIEYLVLCADGKITALPAKGFTSGPAYTELKIGGTSTKRFFYSVAMIPAEREPDETNINGDMEVLITVEVVGSIYELLPGSDEMYAENVWSAPADAVEYPYHTYPDEKE
ncbi:MAG: hypothetical protein J5859_03510, partial [Clostridia bacterium]|nr:hypothetical protein [Clostridia bacterium]